jgi:hypothetical protein
MELIIADLHIAAEYRYAYLLTFMAMALCSIGAKTPELANDFYKGVAYLIALTVPVILFHIANANGLLDLRSALQNVSELVQTRLAIIFQCGPIIGSVGLITRRILKRRDATVSSENSNA